MLKKKGTLYGVSVGTGDPELITIKGLKILQNSPVIAFPAGIKNKPGIAETIIKNYLQPQQKKIALTFPYTINEKTLSKAWLTAAQTIYPHLMQGKDVAFACEGDISFFSTFTYLAKNIQQLSPETTVIRIPGVSSPMVSACALGIPLTMQQEKIAILPAFYSLESLEKILNTVEIVVLLKVHSVYTQVWQLLEKLNLLSYAQIIEKASFVDQKIYTDISKLPDLKLSYFSLMIISQRQS